MFPVNSAAGLILPDEPVTRPSHGNPVIESLLEDVLPEGVVSSSRDLPRNSVVGVVAPNATADVTAGGDDVPVAKRGRCGQESEGESLGKVDRARLRPNNVVGRGSGWGFEGGGGSGGDGDGGRCCC